VKPLIGDQQVRSLPDHRDGQVRRCGPGKSGTDLTKRASRADRPGTAANADRREWSQRNVVLELNRDGPCLRLSCALDTRTPAAVPTPAQLW
jgi:hypothetical protein